MLAQSEVFCTDGRSTAVCVQCRGRIDAAYSTCMFSHCTHAVPQDGEQDENIRQVQAAVRWAWLYVFMPLLFCLIGTGIDFSTETSSTISDACAIVFSGACAVSKTLPLEAWFAMCCRTRHRPAADDARQYCHPAQAEPPCSAVTQGWACGC